MWGAAIGAGADIFSSIFGASSAKKAADVAWHRMRKAYKHRYQWQMKDMLKAGLNPILAYQQGAGSVGTPSPADTRDVGAGVRSASAKLMAAPLQQATVAATTNSAAKLKKEAEILEIQKKTENAKQSMAMDRAEMVAWDRHKRYQELAREGEVVRTKEDELNLQRMGAQTRAFNAAASASSARAALDEAGLPVAQFEGSGGKYLLKALQMVPGGSSAKAFKLFTGARNLRRTRP